MIWLRGGQMSFDWKTFWETKGWCPLVCAVFIDFRDFTCCGGTKPMGMGPVGGERGEVGS